MKHQLLHGDCSWVFNRELHVARHVEQIDALQTEISLSIKPHHVYSKDMPPAQSAQQSVSLSERDCL